jgi:solute carrier family 10 (sodium/bile acid cotransporter), member 7
MKNFPFLLSCFFIGIRDVLTFPVKTSILKNASFQRHRYSEYLLDDTFNCGRHHFRRTELASVRLHSSPVRIDSTGKAQPSVLTKAIQVLSKNFFLMGMFVAVGSAKLFPTFGKSGGILRPELLIGNYGVTMVFFLSGLSLELSQLRSAVANWKLNCLVNAIIFCAWPICVGIPLSMILPSVIGDGILILSCLPTTINMCLILTSAAGGNVAAALCTAVISNMLGIFITPALIFGFFGASSMSLPFGDMVVKLSNKVLLPVAIGQLFRATPLKKISKTVAVKRLQEVVLLSIIWNAFCNAFSTEVAGLSMRHGIYLAMLLPSVHLASLGILFTIVSRLGFRRMDVVAAVFCGSQKTVAFGLPLIHTIFAGTGANLALYTAPVMFMFPLQLMLGSLVVPKLRNYIANDVHS